MTHNQSSDEQRFGPGWEQCPPGFSWSADGTQNQSHSVVRPTPQGHPEQAERLGAMIAERFTPMHEVVKLKLAGMIHTYLNAPPVHVARHGEQ